jgi:hypothetical protein
MVDINARPTDGLDRWCLIRLDRRRIVLDRRVEVLQGLHPRRVRANFFQKNVLGRSQLDLTYINTGQRLAFHLGPSLRAL